MKRIVLIGDSIRLGYEDVVRRELAGRAEILSPEDNGGNSLNVLAHLKEWVISREPDVVHINCGLHDIKREFGAAHNAVPLTAYKLNVKRIIQNLLHETRSRVVWATTTPVNQAWHPQIKGFDRFEADVVDYNRAAREMVEEFGLEINDLCSLVIKAGRDRLLQPDGVHFSPAGCELLGKAVAKVLGRFVR